MSWPLIRRARFFLWCVWQAVGMSLTSRASLRSEACERMRRDPPLSKCRAAVPPPLIVMSVAGAFDLADTPANRAATMLHCVGGFGVRPQANPQA